MERIRFTYREHLFEYHLTYYGIGRVSTLRLTSRAEGMFVLANQRLHGKFIGSIYKAIMAGEAIVSEVVRMMDSATPIWLGSQLIYSMPFHEFIGGSFADLTDLKKAQALDMDHQ
jgi:hypothetical protein